MTADRTITADVPATVVLVDDDDALRAALRFSLEIEGYRIEACRTGEQLLELELPTECGCLVLDYRLKGLNGLESLEELRRRGVTLPAILITSYATSQIQGRARRAHAEVIEKPLLGDALLGRIHALLPDSGSTAA